MDTDAGLSKRKKAFKRGGTNRKAKVPERFLEKGNDLDDCLMSGHLHTLKDDVWKKLWFVLREGEDGNVFTYTLYTYEASEDARATGTCPLLGYQYSFGVEVCAAPDKFLGAYRWNSEPLFWAMHHFQSCSNFFEQAPKKWSEAQLETWDQAMRLSLPGKRK